MMALLHLFVLFFRIGLFSFGGGYVMLPLIFQGIQEFDLMTAEEFSKLVALSQVTPGPIAINAATYVGFQQAGVVGATVATFGMMLPSFIIVLSVMHFMQRFQESAGLNAVIRGIRPVTIGLLATAVIFLAQTSIVRSTATLKLLVEAPLQTVNLLPLLLCIAATVIYAKKRMDPIKLTVLGGVLGALLIR